MKRLLCVGLILIFFSANSALASGPGSEYVYTVNLTKVKDDRLMIELSTPKITENEVIFYLPKIIPGTYKIANYGRFAGDFKAFDKRGGQLEVERVDENTWKIMKAKKLSRITYWVEDTYDATIEGPQVFPMAGTNIEDKKNFVLNTPGYFGYFKGMEKAAFELNVIRPSNFYGSTGLIQSGTKNLNDLKIDLEGTSPDEDLMVDVFNLEDYHHLVDSPLMYCVPDTTILRVADTEVLISVYSPKGVVKSDYIGKNVEEILMAQKEFLGGKLPVDKYAFIFYFEDISKLAPVQGALEHSYSSYYYLPEVPQENLRQTLRDVAAHEFFHIVTPLNIHSEEIEYFDFNNPKMSQHLWLYEGMTEYFAGLVQVKYDIISKEEYMDKLRGKMVNASNQYNDSLSFTDLSKFTLDKYPDEYNNVYEKGALIGMCLDIKLRQLSDGAYGVQDLVAELSQKYGKSTPFKDEELFDVIEELTYPEIREFIDRYVVDGGVLPYEEVLSYAGIDYKPIEYFEDLSFGFNQATMGIDFQNQKLFIQNSDKLDAFGQALGFQDGDVLLAINGEEIPGFQGIQAFLNRQREALVEGSEWTYDVQRGEEEVELKAIVQMVEKPAMHILSLDEEASEEQLQVRDYWLEAEK